ncbi:MULTISPECIES: aldehyde dehydrogenase family protein [unclassified Arthrobacter]|uniref:aldehyde dehydrogenase family protein n=1 Tax=unclassified Arthrobacter TaxID=235627 RepID=UPI001E36402E|nr:MULTISPECIES: aldehyde dehydrogenase family protein [unclassified Arthrobacter]MCC9144332.1 aldehyde dehydrogenase family protein [Arthrobacter sp. zg-Y919]MDK1275558.1 aldehyde dehydrogenase family protein [Arthrobacter sp. zg.Y919]WIB03068.1 aldehyde dehydrogenase family protein [Arthrobacter sp. zg-Y919]
MSTTIRPKASAAPGTAVSPDLITILDPRDGTVVGSLEPTSRAGIRAAVAAARDALPGWAGTAPAERGRLLRAAAAALGLRAAELAGVNTRETGRPEAEALAGVHAGVAALEQYAELGPVHRGHSLRGGVLAADYTVAGPRGVAVVLTPWNDPVAVAAGLIGAALAAGNTVVAKPSERSPHTGKLLGEILAPVFPAGVLATVTGGADVGAHLSMDTEVDVLAHVGSSETGERIARAAALTGAHVILENGGNDPLLVDGDVDPQWGAGQAAVGAFSNSGQICTSVERIYVHRSIADAFCAGLTAEARQRNVDRAVAPLVDTRLRDAVHRQVAQALARGATVAEGGVVPEGPGAHYPATVLLNCSAGMDVFDAETFGPVAAVQVVDSFEEGLGLAAQGDYGLAATVLTGSIAHAQRAVAGLEVGTVKINAVFGGAPGGSAQPRRRSGRGFGYGPELLDEFSLVKVVHMASPGPASPASPA